MLSGRQSFFFFLLALLPFTQRVVKLQLLLVQGHLKSELLKVQKDLQNAKFIFQLSSKLCRVQTHKFTSYFDCAPDRLQALVFVLTCSDVSCSSNYRGPCCVLGSIAKTNRSANLPAQGPPRAADSPKWAPLRTQYKAQKAS